MNNASSFSLASLARTLVVCSFVVLGLSSLALFVVARLTGLTFLGLSKDSWESLNIWFGFVALLAALLYTVAHGRDWIHWISGGTGKRSTESVVALVFCVLLALGSISDIGPFASFNRRCEINKHAQTAVPAVSIELSEAQAWFPQAQRVTCDRGDIRISVYDAQGDLLGFLLNSDDAQATLTGYAGPVPLHIALNPDGHLLGINLGPNWETPSFIQYLDDQELFYQWDGLSIEAATHKQVDTITGATLSSRAIIQALQRTLSGIQAG